MSRQDRKYSLSEWIEQKLAALQQQAMKPEPGSPGVEQLLTLLAQQSSPPTIDDGDMEMFSLVVHEALAGSDIEERYPAFYRKMAANPPLYEAFLELTAVLQTDGRYALSTLPPTTESELAFLDKEPVRQPTFDRPASGQWRITWKLLFDQLQQLLFPAPQLAFRSAASLLEDESVILLNDEQMVDGQLVEVILEAVRPIDQPDVLRLQVMAGAAETLPAIQATLHWGAYQQTAVLDVYGRAQFPPLPQDDLFDEAGRLRAEDLQLILAAAPNPD